MAIFDLQHPLTFAFGVIGNLASLLVFLAPVPTFVRIYREKSTMGFQALPYVVALFSSMLWVYYAFLKKNAFLVFSINSLGCFIEILYIAIFLFYGSKKTRKHTLKLIGLLDVALSAMIFLFSLFVLKKDEIRVQAIGWICVIVSVCVFVAPLSIVFQVIRAKSVEFMPFPLSFFLTLSAIMWSAYGILQKDMCVAFPNVVGFFLGALQMLLYGIYRNPKPEPVIEVKKLPEQVVNILNLGKHEVHVVDPKTSGNVKDEKGQYAQEEKRNEESISIHVVDPKTCGNVKDEKGQYAQEEKRNEESISIKVEADDLCRAQVNVKLESPVLVVCTV